MLSVIFEGLKRNSKKNSENEESENRFRNSNTSRDQIVSWKRLIADLMNSSPDPAKSRQPNSRSKTNSHLPVH